jgi:hypothetical protein
MSGNIQKDNRIKFMEILHGGNVLTNKKIINIPFTIKGPHIILIKAKINKNKKSEYFVFDTSGQTILDLSLTKKYKIKTEELKDGIYLSKLKSISFKEITINDYSPFIMDFSKKFGNLIQTSGVNLAGMIGCDLLKFFTITIDYKNKFITLTTSNNNLKSKNKNQFLLDMKILFPYHPSIKININDKITLDGRIDTGFMYSVGLPIRMINKLLTVEDKKALIKSKGAFALWPGAETKFNYLYKFNKIKIGNIVLKNQPVIFEEFPKALGNNYIILGKTFLENYKTTIDFKKRKVLFSKLKNNNKSLSFSIGINIIKKNNCVLVNGIWKNSPADIRGIKLGDIVLTINNKHTKSVPLNTIYNILYDKSIKRIKLRIKKSNGEIISLILYKKYLI